MNKALLFAIAVYAVFNLVVMRSLSLDNGLTARQKLLQSLLCWLVPLIGPCLVIALQGQNHTRSEMRALIPFPFYLAGHTDRPDNPFKSQEHGVDNTEWSAGEGTCGSD